jgi:hypothetical protein
MDAKQVGTVAMSAETDEKGAQPQESVVPSQTEVELRKKLMRSLRKTKYQKKKLEREQSKGAELRDRLAELEEQLDDHVASQQELTVIR